jgi:DNA-binding response OmpR family regulator
MAKRSDHAQSSAGSNPVRVRFDRFELDEANARLLRDGTAVALPPTPFAVLCALVRQPGTLLSTNALLDEVWGHQFVTDSVMTSAIRSLFGRHRPAAYAMRRIVHQRHGRPALFFRGFLIGVAIVMVIWLVTG